MATNDYVLLDLPESRLLAELASASYDFDRANEFASQLRAAYSTRPMNASLIEPLTIAAIVQYCRPFTTKNRKLLREKLLGLLSPDQMDKHEWIRAVRNKHIAHSENTFEDSHATARFWVERVKSEGISSIGYIHERVTSIGKDDAAAISHLCDMFLRYISEWIKQEQTELLSIVRGMPIDDVLAYGRGCHMPDLNNPNRPRA